ncbi:endochitinase chi3 [Diaporthe amygdali]|uniref:endochitinase chi3 n=1 Tax=Phomopsis amygdali TaxID=1214568 RepID=UPI0022FE09C2|nr:endochitinase chi3 [Diaporthe amygdali]KAJ0120777.1 endochitinase chi3 [Diaporthe amygdali]
MRLPTLAAIAFAAGSVNAAPHVSRHRQRTVKRAGDVGDGSTVMTFYGQSTEPTDLSEVCENDNFDIVILAFITSLNPPKLNMGKDTGSPSDAQKKQEGWELFDGTVAPEDGKSIADKISDCQGKGKKVMISFGGDERFSNATFSSEDEAKEAADQVWNLYLGGTDSTDLRPFGEKVTLDGLDLDNESGNGKFYQEFVTEMRSKMGTDSSRTYLMSAEPMCAFFNDADSSIPDSVLPMLDFVNIQFYNNEAQGIGGKDFNSAIQSWAKKFAAASPSPKLFLGVPGGEGAASTNIQSADEIKDTITSVKNMNITGFGGVGIWDAGFAMKDTAFPDAVKSSLA